MDRLAPRPREVAGRVRVADGPWSRLRGLIGRPPLEPGEGLLIEPCRGVHTYGMRYPIDVAFLAEDGRVVALYPGLEPGTRTPWHRRARRALELSEGALGTLGVELGDVLREAAA